MVERAVAERYQKRFLWIVSTGTTFGIVATGLLALGVASWGMSWRGAWWVFAAISLSVVLAPQILLSKQHAFAQGRGLDMRKTVERLRRRDAVPLYGLAFSFGATNGTYLSYWIDHISQSGGWASVPAELIGPVLFVAFGLAGCLSLLTGDLEQATGLLVLLFGLFLSSSASLLLLAFMPSSWPGAVVSAAQQGICVMALSAVYSFWSESLFPDIPSAGFTAVLMLYAFGNVVGPPLAGLVSGQLGLDTTLSLFGA